MSGDLSIARQPAAWDLVASARGAYGPAPRPRAREGSAPGPAEPEILPGARQQPEAGRLRTLLTDPSMRVSTHHDEASGRTVLQVHSRATGEVVEQIPAETLLRLSATLREPLIDECA